MDPKNFYEENQLKLLASILVFTVVSMYLFSLTHERRQDSGGTIMKNASLHDCGIEYSETKCVNGRLKTGFFNPNNREITFVKLFVPVRSGTNIYNVDEPLPPNETGTLTTAECNKKTSKKVQLKWCCGEKCFKTKMANPSQDLTLVE